MQRMSRSVFVAVVVWVVLPASAQAGWSVWPFGEEESLPKQPAPTRQLSGGGKRQTLDQSDPSIFTRLTTGPQKFMTSTKQMLSLNNSKPTTRTTLTGSSSKKKKKSESSSWFGWLRPAEPEGPKTVSEWFKLKRPE